jgi:carboxypeptidase Q
MRARKSAALIAAAVLCWSFVAASQESVDLAVVDRIKNEAFARSEVMEHLRNLTDVHGPRLTGSPQFEEAAKWATEQLTTYGLSNVHVERWGRFGRSWSVEQYSAEMVAPHYLRLVAMPLAWSNSTAGALTGEPLLAPIDIGFIRGPKKIGEDFSAYRKQWSGKLRGKIVLLTASKPSRPREGPLFNRYSDAELADLARAPEPAALHRITMLDELEWPEKPEDVFKLFMSMPESLLNQLIDRYDEISVERSRFFNDEGVAAILMADDRAREGLIAAEQAGSYRSRDPLAPPTFVVTAEHYGRIARLIEHSQPVRVRLDLKTVVSRDDVDGGNIVGEIPGGARKDELVMVGAHFDSWHSGTGATDNGAGSAVMIEVMRILKALNLKLDRTVRIALWGGEEQGLLGSRAYVKAHFADPSTMELKTEHAKLSGYFNLDNGSGRIRGVYLQGHEAMRPIFEQWLAPFRDSGVTTMTIRNTGGTDHLSFARVGLPAFQFIQDSLDYETLTHHTSADTYDHAVAADLMQASAVIASVVCQAANRAERLPRRELPKAEPKPRKVSEEKK